MKAERRKRSGLWLTAAAAVTCIVCCAATGQAGELTSDALFGYKMYFKHHPPKEKPVRNNLYPFQGPVIPYGQDIPICAAAKAGEAYENKQDLRYLMHGKHGWIFRTADFRTDFTAAPKALEYFSRLNRLLAAKKQTLVVLFQPPRGMIGASHIDTADMPRGYTPERARDGYQSFIKQLNEAGVRTADMSDLPRDAVYYPKGDFRWTPDGAAYSARKIAAVLEKLPGFKDLQRREFETKIAGMAPPARGVFEEFIQNTCKANIELTAAPVWTTVEKSDGKARQANRPFPAITVLGTNNSSQDDKYNFVGALKQLLRADIHNAALADGGFGASPARYFASDVYHAHPPKFVVWEFTPQHNYNSQEAANAFRQMIPAVYGACTKETALTQDTTAVAGPQTNILSGARDFSLKDAYLYLEVLEPRERSLKLEVLYADGNSDQVDMTRSARMANNGKYYFDLGADTVRKPLFFHVLTDIPQGHVTARICRYPVNVAVK